MFAHHYPSYTYRLYRYVIALNTLVTQLKLHLLPHSLPGTDKLLVMPSQITTLAISFT